MQWTGRPAELPRLHAVAYRTGSSEITTFHISWYGATEVASWVLYRADGTKLTSVSKSGFETMAQIGSVEHRVYAEALDTAGIVIGRTEEIDVVQHLARDVVPEAPDTVKQKL